MKQKKLLYISNRLFWPPMGGHEVEMYHYCKGLHEQFNYDIDVYAFTSLKEIPAKPEFLEKVILAQQISGRDKIYTIIIKSIVNRNPWPIQCALYYTKNNEEKIRRIAKKNQYDAIIVDMVRLAPYLEAFHDLDCKKILDIDDTLSKRYRRQLKTLDAKSVIAGQYNNRLPRFLQKVLKSVAVKKSVLKFEIPRMEHAEQYYSERYDNVIFVSSIETEEFNAKYNTNKAVTVSMGVDYKYYSEDLNIEKELGIATFVGNMKTAANADSVRMIVNKVLPHSNKLKKMLFIGGVSDELKNEFKGNPRVEFIGRVEDVRSYVEKGMVFLAPLTYGTGIKTKILEAMAMKMPVITNSVGAEGIPGENGKTWYVSDDYLELGKIVDLLIMESDLCARIGSNAQMFVKKDFQWEKIIKQFEKLGL